MQYTEGFLLDGRYRLDRFVGRGSFGEVWVSTDLTTDLEVAVKIYVAMDEKGLSEFKKEFQLSFEFNHTHLLHANYLGVNPSDNRPYLVMPYCPDGSVSAHLGKLTEQQLWKFIRDVASGLAYLHAQEPPIIHQDIKPDNILILKNGDYVITDFGISRQLRASLRKSSVNVQSAGSIAYMGPERFGKKNDAVKASDIWSLGVSIYELAEGELPFCGMGGSLQKQGAELPDLSDRFSEQLTFILHACLTAEPWFRPSAAELAHYADAVLNGEPGKTPWEDRRRQAQDTAAPARPVAQGRAVHAAPSASALNAQPVPAEQPAAAEKTSVLPGWVWAALAVAGLAIGAGLGFLF